MDFSDLKRSANSPVDAFAAAAAAAAVAADSSGQVVSFNDGTEIEMRAVDSTVDWALEGTTYGSAQYDSTARTTATSTTTSIEVTMRPETTEMSSPPTTSAVVAAALPSGIVPEYKLDNFDATEVSGTVKISYDGEEARRERDVDISEDLRKEFEKIDNILLDFMQSDEKVHDIRGVKGGCILTINSYC